MTYLPLAAVAGLVHVCGHRGHSAGAPENTIPALQASAHHGADVCEIDIVLTKDQEVVLLHDELLDRTTDGKGWVSDLTVAEVARLDAGAWFAAGFAGTRVPTLLEALEASRSLSLALHIEIKERRRTDLLIDRLGEILAATGAVEDVLVISFDHPSLVRARTRIPNLRTELITHARHVDPVAMARRAEAASVAIEWDMFHSDDAQALHQAGIAVRVTIPRSSHVKALRTYGVDVMQEVLSAVREGVVDILAGDDVEQVAALVKGQSRSG
jgi:glycerophosphoryl diester phosphodiesterase